MVEGDRMCTTKRRRVRNALLWCGVPLLLAVLAGCVTGTTGDQDSSAPSAGSIALDPTPVLPLDTIVVNEVVLKNDTLQDTRGGYPLWIELHNVSDSPISLKDWHLEYTIAAESGSETPSTRVRISRFPERIMEPQGFLLLVFTQENASLPFPGIRISGMDLHGVEQVDLFDPANRIVDSFTIPDKALQGESEEEEALQELPPVRELSAIRDPQLISAVRLAATPTPGMANDTVIQPPIPVMPSGRYGSGDVQIGFEPYGFDEGWRIRYTMNDGTEYDETGNLVAPRAWILPHNTDGAAYEQTGDVYPDRTVVVKARRYSPTGASSPEVVVTYLIDEPTKLPVVSLTLDPRDLWDAETGIYIIGPDPDQPNYRKRWFRAAGFTFFPEWSDSVDMSAQTQPGIVDTYRLRLYGSSSKAAPTKSFAIYADEDYSTGARIPNLFFDGSAGNIDSFSSIVLRNSGGDNERTYMRDGMMSTLATGLDVDKQDVQPAVIYLNGQFWGLLNIREKVNENFLKDHHPEIDEDSLDIIEGTFRREFYANEGTRDEAIRLYDLSKLTTAGVPFIYERFTEYLDIESFIDYVIIQTFINNTDWPWSNVKYWREHAEGSLWRFILYDMDGGFDTQEYWTAWLPEEDAHGRVDFPMVEHLLLGNPTDLVSTLFRALMRNEEFFTRFLDRYDEELATRFTTEALLERVDAFASLIETDVPRHALRWTGSDELVGYDRYVEPAAWEQEVQILRDFALQRPAYVHAELQRVRAELHPDDPELISNGDFSDGDADWNLGWSPDRTSQEVVERSDGSGLAGRVQILQGGEQFWQAAAFVHDDIPIPSGYTVTLSFDIRTSNAWRSSDELQVILFEPESGDEILQIVTRPKTSWTTVVKQVKYTGKEYLNTRLQFRVGKVSTGKDLLIDNVTIDVVKE